MASTPVIAKITHGTEIRRFTTTVEMSEGNKYKLTWAALSKRVAEFFELPKLFKLTYVDDEGDRITLSSDAELHEAIPLALAASPAVLRLGVYIAPVESRSTGSSADVPMSDAATEPESKSTADAGTNAKPSTADAATHGEAKPNTTESSTGTGTPHGPHGEEVERFIQ